MRMLCTAFAALCLLLPGATPGRAMDAGMPAFLTVKRAASAPDGAASLCQTYPWACAREASARAAPEVDLDLVAKVNRAVNAAVPAITDQAQYGKAEHWSLPGAQGGDCEDYALFKKQSLIAAGIPAQHLLIAVVLDRQEDPHAVLILRSAQGDHVLDNMTNRILPWNRTGYTFISMQNPDDPARWVAVFQQAPRRMAAQDGALVAQDGAASAGMQNAPG